MKTAGRNDPCPCGSGKKYKACCRAAHEARARVEQLVGADALRDVEARLRSVAREAPAWEADVVPVPFRVGRDADSAPALVMVAAGGLVVHGGVVERGLVGLGERARAVAEALSAAGRAMEALPARLRVRDEALAGALAGELAPRGIGVEAAPMPALDEALDFTLENLAGSPVRARMSLPLAWAQTEASEAELAGFHHAAAAFAAAEPWDALEGDDALLLAFSDGVEWVASVMGGGGMQFGLAMYSAAADILDLLESGPFVSPEVLFGRMRGMSLTVSLDAHGEVTRAMRREVAKGGWPLDGARRYPRLYGVHLPERRVTAAHVRRATLALRAVALFAERRDPEPETGVRVSLLPLGDEAEEWPSVFLETN